MPGKSIEESREDLIHNPTSDLVVPGKPHNKLKLAPLFPTSYFHIINQIEHALNYPSIKKGTDVFAKE